MAFNFFPAFKLNDFLASNASANEGDVLNVKNRLNALGHYQSPIDEITSMSDNGLFTSIRNFQREKGLTIDGYMRPGGETKTVLNKAIAERPRPDPKTERQEAVIAFAGKYGTPEDKARESFKFSSPFRRVTQPQQSIPHSLTPQASPSSPSTAQTSPSITLNNIPNIPNTVSVDVQKKKPEGIAFRGAVTAQADQARNLAWKNRRFDSGLAVGQQRYFYPHIKEKLVEAIPRPSPQEFPKFKSEWDEYHNAFSGDTTMTSRQQRILGNTFALEGLMAKTENTTPGGFVEKTRRDLIALTGKTDAQVAEFPARQRAYRTLKEHGMIGHGDFDKATPQQVAALHRAYYDDVLATVGGIDVLDSIDDDNAAAAFADTMFMHGRGDGASILQRVINKRRRELGEKIMIDQDGAIGPDVVKEYQRLIGTKESKQRLMQLLADERRQAAPKTGGFIKKGVEERINYFQQGGS